jgi:transposase
MRNKNYSYGKIAEELNLTKSTVALIIKRKLKFKKKKVGPKYKIDKRKSLIIRRFINQENKNGNKVNCRVILNETSIDVKRRTLCDWLRKQDFKYKKVAQKIVLSKKHKERRLSVVSTWISQNIIWEKCIFSDEKRFCLDGPDNWYVYVYPYYMSHIIINPCYLGKHMSQEIHPLTAKDVKWEGVD